MSGERRRKTKGHYDGAFSVFLFAQKQSIYSSVLQHKYIRKELYYSLLGTKKKNNNNNNVMKAELTDFLHLLYALTSLIIS